jgi:hypothetical protein
MADEDWSLAEPGEESCRRGHSMADAFYQKDGWRRCRTCANIRAATRRAVNPDMHRAYMRAYMRWWRSENRDHYLAYQRRRRGSLPRTPAPRLPKGWRTPWAHPWPGAVYGKGSRA